MHAPYDWGPYEEDLRYLIVFAAVSEGEGGSVQNLPLPDGISDWEAGGTA